MMRPVSESFSVLKRRRDFAARFLFNMMSNRAALFYGSLFRVILITIFINCFFFLFFSKRHCLPIYSNRVLKSQNFCIFPMWRMNMHGTCVCAYVCLCVYKRERETERIRNRVIETCINTNRECNSFMNKRILWNEIQSLVFESEKKPVASSTFHPSFCEKQNGRKTFSNVHWDFYASTNPGSSFEFLIFVFRSRKPRFMKRRQFQTNGTTSTFYPERSFYL